MRREQPLEVAHIDIEQAVHVLQSPSNFYDVGIINASGIRVPVHSKVQPGAEGETLLQELANTPGTQGIFIDVFRPNGNSKKKISTVVIQVEDEEMEASNTGGRGLMIRRGSGQVTPLQADWMAEMFAEQKEAIIDLRSEKRALEAEVVRLKNDVAEKERKLAFKDYETELKIRALEMEQKGGLNGVMNTISANPAFPQLLGMLATKLLGSAEGQAAPLMGQGRNTAEAAEVATWLDSLPLEHKAGALKVIKNLQENPELLMMSE